VNHLIGQFHPLFVHLPIGILIIAFAFKLWSLRSDQAKYENILAPLTGCAFLVSIGSAFTGYLLSLVGGYEDELLNYHKWSGFTMAALSAYYSFQFLKNGILLFKRWHGGVMPWV
jgi:uncharacterized membrane protein